MPSLTLTWLIVLTLGTSFLVFVFSWTSTWSMGCQETTYSVLLKCSIWQSVTTSSLRWNPLDNTPLRAPCSYHLACQNSTLTTLISNTYMASSSIFHAHTKHIELGCHYINFSYLTVIMFSIFPPPIKLQIFSLRGFTSIGMSFWIPYLSTLDGWDYVGMLGSPMIDVLLHTFRPLFRLLFVPKFMHIPHTL